MITLAAGGGDLVFLIAMLVFGAINWFANKAKEGQAPKNPTVTPRAPKPAPGGGDAEAERMRRFLDALGVPTDAAPTPAPKPVTPSRPPQRPRVEKPKRSAPPPPLPPVLASLDEADAPAAPAADIRVPELRTPELPVFETVSSRVMADPDGDFTTVSSKVSAVPAGVVKADPTRVVRFLDRQAVLAAIHSPESLRTALILREVLGPPLSLRS